MGKNKSSDSGNTDSSSGSIVLLGAIALIAVALLGYLFKDNIWAMFGKTDVAPDAKKTSSSVDAEGSAVNSSVPTSTEITNSFTAALKQVNSAIANSVKQAEAFDAASYFPLKPVSGTALHTPNPYVKDLQQYLNKIGGASLDIDGAFGAETEAAATKILGTQNITREQYNSIIAPPLGKPQV